MATAKYWQRGEALDYTNAGDSTIAANTIVKNGSRIGVTGAPIAPGETGALHVGGVWEMPKSGTNAIVMGQTVYFDGSGITDEADDGDTPTPTAYAEVGYAAAAAGATDTKILVKING